MIFRRGHNFDCNLLRQEWNDLGAFCCIGYSTSFREDPVCMHTMCSFYIDEASWPPVFNLLIVNSWASCYSSCWVAMQCVPSGGSSGATWYLPATHTQTFQLGSQEQNNVKCYWAREEEDIRKKGRGSLSQWPERKYSHQYAASLHSIILTAFIYKYAGKLSITDNKMYVSYQNIYSSVSHKTNYGATWLLCL